MERSVKLSVRLSDDEYSRFLEKWRESKLTQADFLMRCIDNIPMPDDRILEQYKEINEKVDQLRKIVKNIETGW